MSDLISRQAALDAFGLSEKTRKYGGDHSGYDTRMLYEIQNTLESIPSAEPEIIRCGECVNHLGNRCLKADHHTNDIECCMSVFGAERKTDEAD